MQKPNILVVGSYVTGLVMVLDRLPSPGETLIAHAYREVHGGKGSNQAVQAARLGCPVSFVACVGRDARGELMRTLMVEEGVRSDDCQSDPVLATAAAFVVVDTAGRNFITLDMGANAALSAEIISAHPAWFTQAKVVLAQLEIPLASALAAMQAGRAAGATTLLNPAPAADLTGYDLSCIDYLLPNEHEVRLCAGLPLDAPIDDAVARLLACGCRHVLVTLGDAGCSLRSADGSHLEASGFPVHAIDTVGAGDAFCGAFATALAEDQPLPTALRFANAAAALSVTKADTIPSYHTRPAVDTLLKT